MAGVPLVHSPNALAGRNDATTASNEIALLDVLDQTAAMKVTATWGIDYLLVGKYDGRWMISSVLWQSKPRVGP